MTIGSHAQLAQAAYATLTDGMSAGSLVNALQSPEGSYVETQATRFAAEQSVVVQYNDDATGAGTQGTSLSVTVFKDSAGNVTLAIRGTLEAVGDLYPTDVPHIALSGAAYDQIAALYSWWLRASAGAGTPVPQYRLLPTNQGQPDAVSVSGGYLVRAEDAVASGELTAALNGDSDGRIDVTGHSLGGHLAMAFAAIFPTVTSSVTAFNAPGFKDTTDNRAFFQRLGGALPDQSSIGAKTTNVVANHTSRSDVPWQGIAMLHSRPGTAVDVPIENQVEAGEPNKPSSRNHSQMVLTDAVAVYELFDKLQPGLSTALFGRLLAGSSNAEYQGLEYLIGSLRAVLGLGGATLMVGNGTEAREALYLAIDGLQSNSAFQSLAGKVQLNPIGSNLAGQAEARVDFQSFAALHALVPLVVNPAGAEGQTALNALWQSAAWSPIYQAWSADAAMPSADRDAGKEAFTAAWIADRSEMLQALSKRNLQNIPLSLVDRSLQINTTYRDVTRGVEVQVDRTSNTPVPSMPRRQIFFGSAGDETVPGDAEADSLYGGAGNDVLNGQGGADHLEGNAGDDTLNGGADADTLLGQTGADFLEGGTGNDTLLGAQGADTYFFTAGWGHDTIEDSDGQGSLRVPGYDAGLPQGKKDPEGKYQSADDQVTYTVIQLSPTQRNLRIAIEGLADDITVRNWQPGQLGITLDENLPAIVPNYSDSGDDQGAADDRLTAFNDPDGAGPLEGSYVSDVHLAGGNGSDTVLGYTGRDILEGGVGSDIVLGEASVIVGTAPPAGDPGDDRIYGDAEIDVALAISQGNAQTGSAVKGDWLGGQDGDDALVGSAAADVLMGGRGADLLVAGAGDDELNGDDDYVPGTAAPWSVGDMPGNEFERLYTPVISYNRADDFGAGDILYGGAGNDHLLGMAGDDVLYGENDNDTLAGDDDDDVLLGGEGNDRLSGDFGQSTTSTGRVVVQGDDWLDGGAGNDFAQGEGGADTLYGGVGDDELWGDAKTYTDATLNGDDVLDGGDGNDDLIGQGGADALFGGTGDDSLFGDADDTAAAQQGSDYLDGQGGNDYLRGYGGADELWGGDSADELLGDAEDDRLAGDAGADTLSGGDGNDVLTGGAGLDVLLGGAGDDTYVFDLGDGANGVQIEAINDSGGRNTVVFADAQTSTVTVQDDGAGNLIIDYSAGDRVAVIGGVAGSVASYAFAAGQSYTASQLVGRFSSGPVSTLDAQGLPIELGGSAADSLAATAAHATLSGGLGDDTLSGSGGHNTYLYSRGDGADRIVDTSAKTDAQGQPAPNRIVFASGIAAADISLGHSGGDLVLTVAPAGAGDSIRIAGFDAANALGTPAIDSFEFDDGTVLGYSQLLSRGFDLMGTGGDDLMQGTSLADRFDGGAGADTLRGGAGDDTYSLGAGTGLDQVDDADVAAGATDTLRITGTLAPADLQLLRRGDDLWVSLRNSPDRATVINHFAGAGVEQIAFADGTLWDTAAIAAHVTNELTDGADVFTGSAGDDAIDARGGNDLVNALAGSDAVDGGAGDDTLNGGDGSDTLMGGAGNDSLAGGKGADLYRFGTGGGADVIDDQGPDGALDTLRLDAGITPQSVTLSGSAQITLSLVGTGESIRFAGPDAAGAGKIECIEFGDGTVWSEAQWAQRALDDTGATAGGDSITGFAATNDTLRGLDGSDTLAGLAGNDQLDGGAGFDSLDGGDGDDLLIDGETMIGGAGNDTYRVNTWTPYVTRIVIRDVPDVEGNVDALVLPPQVSPAALDARPGGAGPYEDLVLSERATDNSITVQMFFNSQGSDYKIEQIRFADGTVWSVADVFAKVAQTQMTAGNDTVLGFRWGEVLDAQAGNDFVIGHWGDDQLFGGAGDDSMFGDAYDTFYTSTFDGSDTLDGGAGNDTIYGGGGDDTYLFGRGRGSDTVFELGGSDRIELGADVLPADVNLFRVGQALILAIDQGSTQLLVAGQFSGTAGRMIESIRFADGTAWDAAQIQVLAVGGTPNAMTGTAGDDTFVVDDPADTITEAANQGVDTVQSSVGFGLGAHLENLTLTGYLNIFGTGNALNNLITGNAGSNTLRGSGAGVGGRDTFVGGVGDDTYYVDGATGSFGGDVNSDDTVAEVADQGIDTVVTNTLSYALPANVEILRSTITTSAASLVGNGLDNVLEASRGSSAGATLDGGAGADTMRGTQGNDTYKVDNAGDWIEEFGYTTRGQNLSRDGVTASVTYTLGAWLEDLQLVGSSTISGTGNAFDNLLDGSSNPASNMLAGGAGNDTYRLDAGDTVIESAGQGTDAVVLVQGPAGSYAVAMYDNVENMALEAGLGASNLAGDSGANQLTGNGLSNTLSGGDGDDVLADSASASNDQDSLFGDGGSDRLTSNSGADLLDGGAGNDTLVGSGNVTVAFGRGYGADAWTAFGVNGNRLVRLNADLQLGDLEVLRNGTDLQLSFGQGDALTVAGFFVDSTSTTHNGLFGAAQFADGTNLSPADLVGRLVAGNGNTATAGADVLFGSAGNDTIVALTGDDRLFATSGDDDLTGGPGSDLLHGGAGDDTYRYAVGDGQDTVVETGGSADSVALAAGISSSDVTVSRSGLDLRLQIAGVGQIVVQGFFSAAGCEVESVAFADGSVWDNATLKAMASQTTGTSGADVLAGSAAPDRIYGLAGNDTLNGLDGDDLLDGGAGNDSMAGGQGNDTYVVDSASDIVSEASGQGTDLVQAAVTYTLGSNVENLTLSGSANLNGTGNTLANVLTGNAGNNALNGGTGADTLIGGAGNDTYTVDNTGDVVNEMAAEGIDLVQSSVSYTLSAEVENLTLTGSSGLSATGNALDNVLTGNSGANRLTGGAGNDRLDGGSGTDTLVGGTGDDTYVVSTSSDVVTEVAGEGIDTIESTVTFTLGAGNTVENLRLLGSSNRNATGNGLANVLTGNSASNTLTGNAGDDTLDGGAGTDTMRGGAGDDTYVVERSADVTTENANEGSDTVLSSVTRTLGSNLENLTLTGSGTINGTGNTLANVLIGNNGANTLAGLAGDDTYDGGAGNDALTDNSTTSGDTYRFGVGCGVDTITDSGGADTVQFGVGITAEQLVFAHLGNNLEVTIAGNSTDKLVVANHYLGTASRIETFRLSDGTTLPPAVVPLSVAAREVAALSEPEPMAAQRERIMPVRPISNAITSAGVPDAVIAPGLRRIYALPWKLASLGELEWPEPAMATGEGSISSAIMVRQAQGLISAMAAFGGEHAALGTERQTALPVHRSEPMWASPAVM